MSVSQSQTPAVATAPEVAVEAPPTGSRGTAGNAARAAQVSAAGTPATPATPGTPATPELPAATLPVADQTIALAAGRDPDVVARVTAMRAASRLDPLFAALPMGGTTMTQPLKDAMYKFLSSSAVTVPEARVLFKHRFNHDAGERGATWTMPMLRAVWDQLALLPDRDVSQNTVLATINAVAGGGGTGPSWEAPTVVNTINLGMANSVQGMAHVVRHEIGHAVHAQIPSTVNAWLQGEIGFWFLPGDATGTQTWIEELGGFPANYTVSGAAKTVGENEKKRAAEMLKSYLGPGSSWSPARAAVDTGASADDAALWQAMPQNVKDAVTASPAHWYSNYQSFKAGRRGTYFLNYWYARPFWMSAAAKAIVTATGDNYTAMSEKEFFANAYAEYFKDPAGYADHSKWGGSLPANVKNFFKNNILERQPYTAPAATPAAPAANAAGGATTRTRAAPTPGASLVSATPGGSGIDTP
jgi:hypothetical protein